MERKYKEKEKTEEDYLKEVERINYKTALEAKKTLDSITRTTEKTSAILYEQREKLEDIMNDAETIRDNIEKGKELSVKMKRAGKFITIGDKIGDKLKGMFKPGPPPKRAPSELPTMPHEPACPTEPHAVIDSPTEDNTNAVLLSIRDGLKKLHSRLKTQDQEINNQIPLIKDIATINKSSTNEADKAIQNLKQI
ncbi:hypothetical protein NEDG_00785 [Nematocida displodere]|uniref:Uncharacterized protein n=1 Tax=Nematocida displodere TaxID=1805483 RepID=A0A177EET7_9MICR|nr:hypothetical protein NEDG_00785 [Nematocida displodere]